MVKVVKKSTEVSANPKAALPAISDEIFKLKIDRDTQKFFIDGLESYGQFSEVLIRPLDLLNKIVAYDDEFKVKAESTLYHELKEASDTWGAAAIDKNVGKVCGRIVWKNLTDKLSEDEKQENKDKAKFYAMVFGIATVQGKEPLLVDFRIGGTKFMDTINTLKKIKEDKTDYNRAEVRFKLTQGENWPDMEIMPDFSRELSISGLEPFIDTVEAYIQDHNQKIREKAEKYQAYKKSKPTSFKRK